MFLESVVGKWEMRPREDRDVDNGRVTYRLVWPGWERKVRILCAFYRMNSL